MPRHPELSAPAAALPASIFARLVERAKKSGQAMFPFHLGDSCLTPPPAALLDARPWGEGCAKLYAYGPPAGEPELLDAVVTKLAEKNKISATTSMLQVTAGATHGFSCVARAVLDPGDEIVALTPRWPLIRGHILSVGGVLVEAPTPAAGDLVGLQTALESKIGPRTAALYFITPNNPDGRVLSHAELDVIADVARRHNLWVLADEVYEDYVYEGTHVSIATLPGMAERTITAYSFSKSYACAGLRVGYVVAPEPMTVAIRKLANHSVYNVPRALQAAALGALREGASWLERAREELRATRDVAVGAIPAGLPFRRPAGGAYVFVDLASVAERGDIGPALERLADAGVLVAPGDAFGRDFATWVRVCYTAVPRGAVVEGLLKMAVVLGRA